MADDILIYGIGRDVTTATRDHDKNIIQLMERCLEKGRAQQRKNEIQDPRIELHGIYYV